MCFLLCLWVVYIPQSGQNSAITIWLKLIEMNSTLITNINEESEVQTEIQQS